MKILIDLASQNGNSRKAKKLFQTSNIRTICMYSHGKELFYKFVSKITNKVVKQLLSMTVYYYNSQFWNAEKGGKSLLPYIHNLWWKSKHLKKWFSKVFKQMVYKWKTLYYFQRSLRIYLIPKVVREDENGLTTPIEYCISLNVITQEWQGEFTLLTTASKICPQVASCGLPAVHLPEQHLCITGLCSVLRHLVAQLSPHQTLLGN